MSLIINGTERDTLMLNNSIYRYVGEHAEVATANASDNGSPILAVFLTQN